MSGGDEHHTARVGSWIGVVSPTTAITRSKSEGKFPVRPRNSTTCGDADSNGNKEGNIIAMPQTWGSRRTNSSSDGFLDNEIEGLAAQALERSSQEEDNSDDINNTSTRSVRMDYITQFRQLCGKIVNYPYVQHFIILLIVINAIMMGIATFDFVSDNPGLNKAFETTDLVFLIIFTVELAMQFIYHGLRLFRDGWLVFDFVIILLSWSLSSMQIIRAFRIFRALRLVTRVQILRDLISALIDVMPKMAAITALLLLIFYIFAVMFTVLFSNLDLSEDYFTSLDTSFFTLFQIMTLDWVNPARECMAIYGWAWAPFVTFVMISAFIVYNLIIAVVCDAVAMVESVKDTPELREDATCHSRDPATLQIQELKVKQLENKVAVLMKNEIEMQKRMNQTLRRLGIPVIEKVEISPPS